MSATTFPFYVLVDVNLNLRTISIPPTANTAIYVTHAL